MFRAHLFGASLELDLRCTSGLSARVTNPDHPHKIMEHIHQEVARIRSAGSLIPAGNPVFLKYVFQAKYFFLLLRDALLKKIPA